MCEDDHDNNNIIIQRWIDDLKGKRLKNKSYIQRKVQDSIFFLFFKKKKQELKAKSPIPTYKKSNSNVAEEVEGNDNGYGDDDIV